MKKLHDVSTPIARLFLSAIFITSGFTKISNYAGTQGYMEAMGVPVSLLPLVIALEVIGGFAVLIGFKARLAALAMAGFSAISAILFHADFNDATQMAMFMKNIAIAGGFLMIVGQGAGAYSLDNRNPVTTAL